jgi:hypothetical protein
MKNIYFDARSLSNSYSPRMLDLQNFKLWEKYSENFSTPSGCPTGIDRLALEMISKILFAIETVMNRIYPQNRLQPCFAKREEFAFVHEKSNSLFYR